jgi:ABC-2 type transport system permease protein
MLTIFRKEMADYFTSIRVFILFVLTLLVSAATLYSSFLGIRGTSETEFVFLKLFTTQGEGIPSLFTFVNLIALFFIPIIGIALGFDVINSEHSGRTLSRILSQPVFRDNVINAKFLAGMVTLSIMVVTTLMLVAGYGLRLIGVPPTSEEIFRLFIYLVFAIVYGAFWMGLAILFSVLFRRISTSLLSSVAVWLFFGFFYVLMIAPAIANAIAPTANADAATLVRNVELQFALLRVSPNFLFLEASTVLLQPPLAGTLLGVIGILVSGAAQWMIPNPISLSQSMLLIWPHLTLLISLTLICFAISYVVFMRQEIRTT